MIKRLLENEEEVKHVLVNDWKTAHLLPSWQDMKVLESVNEAMEPLAELTDIMSGSKFVTVSSLKPMLYRLEKQVLVMRRPPDEPHPEGLLHNKLRANVLQDLLSRYKPIRRQLLLNITTFLDPRFKVCYNLLVSYLLHTSLFMFSQ